MGEIDRGLCIEPVQDPGGLRDPGERSANTESFITTGEWRAREIARSSDKLHAVLRY